MLELVKQPAGKPKSMHFTTPVTDAEARLLTSQPVWRISWCDDPRAAQVRTRRTCPCAWRAWLNHMLTRATPPPHHTVAPPLVTQRCCRLTKCGRRWPCIAASV